MSKKRKILSKAINMIPKPVKKHGQKGAAIVTIATLLINATYDHFDKAASRNAVWTRISAVDKENDTIAQRVSYLEGIARIHGNYVPTNGQISPYE